MRDGLFSRTQAHALERQGLPLRSRGSEEIDQADYA
jgi:hypothetical protein